MAPRGGDEAAIASPTQDMDWPWLQSLNPKELIEDDLQRLVPIVTKWAPNDEEETSNLLCMFKLASSALKSRDEDLNEAIEALGEREADKEIKAENKKLKRENKELKKESRELEKQLKRFQKAKTEGGQDEALDDILALEQQLEQSEKTKRQMEKDLERERLLKEDSEKKIKLINVEKEQLRRDVESLRDELDNVRTKPGEEGGSGGKGLDEVEEKKVRDLEDTVRMKNKQIQSLLEDIDQVERESVEYQNKVVELRDQMSETTKQINAMTGEYVAMKESALHYDSLIAGLQEENDRVRALLDEMLQDKKKRDEQMDQVETQVEKRISQMKDILEFKEATIEELRARLNRAALEANQQDPRYSQENVSLLTQAIRDRDEQIEQLQEKLSEASREIESSAALIEGFTKSAKKGGKGVDPIQKSLISVRGQLQKSEEKVKELEENLKEAEEAAREKSEELSSTVAQLRAYEKGEYGLEQAVEEVRKLKKAEKIKEQKIQELTESANTYQYQVGELLEEVNSYREKTGAEPYDQSNLKDGLRAQQSQKHDNLKRLNSQKQKDRALLQVMGREIERLEEERIQLKTENRKMARQLGNKAAELGLTAEDLQAIEDYKQALKARRRNTNDDSIDVLIEKNESLVSRQKDLEDKEAQIESLQQQMVEYKTKFEELLEENGELRKGMQEILEDVKTQDGQSDVMIHCPALEKLVGILDARHLWGNYHPAMGLKAQIDKLDGANSELRDQIRKARLDEDKLVSQLQRSKTKVANLENELSQLKEEQVLVQQQPLAGKNGDLRLAIPSLAGTTSLQPASPMPLSTSSSDLVAKSNLQLIQVLNQLEAKEGHCKVLKEELDNQQSKLSVFRHQMGLVYEQFYQERQVKDKSEKELLEKLKGQEETLESMKAKLQEYEGHFQALNKSEMESKFADTTRKMVILRSNEALLIRKYKALEDSEKILRKENFCLKSDVVKIENKFAEKIGSLQRQKELNSFKMESLQQALSESVPSSALEEANSQYADLTARYRILLDQEHSHSSNERKVEELELVIQGLTHEKTKLKEELQAAKEKLHSVEVMVTRLHSTAASVASNQVDEQPVLDHQLQSLSKQIATLEMKELNEKQRADHSDNKCKLLQAQLQQLERRNEDLEQKFADVTKANLDLQKTERGLRDQLVGSIAREKFDSVNNQVKALESKETELKIENDKLREVADVACKQIELFENRKNTENVELAALRHEIIDLQSQTDEKALIGKLHRQIVSFQMKDNDAGNKIKSLENKLSHAEAQNARLQQKSDEREAWASHIRTQAYIKCKSMFKIIQDLRRQYSGSVPLSRQEKMSEILRDLKEDKRKASYKLRLAEEKLQEAQAKLDELAVKQENVDNFMSALKQGAGTKQVIEWQKKLEELRLRELRSRRQSERWSAEVDHLRDLASSQAKKIDQLEEELVRMENQIEQKQLDWETRQIELENLDEPRPDSKETSQEKAKKDAILTPNPDWPLAKQLEQALAMIKAQTKSIEDNKHKLTEAKKVIDDLKKNLRESDAKVLAKERVINDLRMQIPSSVDRAMAMASVTGEKGLPVSLTTDYESKQALKIAQTTIVSLRERLEQKEETVGRFEKLLKQARNEYENELSKKQEEILSLKSSIRNQSQTIQSLKSSAIMATEAYDHIQNPNSVIREKMQRIAELEDDVIELQTSMSEVSKQLAIAKSDADNYKKSAMAKQKEINDMRETFNMDSQLRQNLSQEETDKFSSEVKMLKSENALLQDELRRAKESAEKTPSSVMSSLVDKLRNDLTEKDKKIRAMGRVIADLKTELVNNAVAKDTTSSVDRSMDLGGSVLHREELNDAKGKIEELTIQNDKLLKQVDSLKAKQVSSYSEIKNLKEELSKKGSLLVKLKEDKLKRPGVSSGQDRSPARSSMDREKDELKKTIKKLEAQLNSINKAEKPLEELQTDIEQEDIDKQIKTATELARWDESKKWQHKIENLKSKLTDADAEVSKLSKTNNSLREMNSRLEREKLMLETRAKSSRNSVKSNINEIKMKELQVENEKLREELEGTRHDFMMQGPQGIETLKLRNKFLQDRIEAQERKIAALEIAKKAGGESSKLVKKLEEIQDKEKECQKQKLKLEEEIVNLKYKLEQNEINNPRIIKAVQELNVFINNLRDSNNEVLALELKSLCDDLVGTPSSQTLAPSSQPKKGPNSKQLMEEVTRLKAMNEDLIAKLEAKNKEMEDLRALKSHPRVSALIKSEDTSLYAVPNMDEIRKMEADLKRKSDLLAEVKVLLKQAADRERSILANKEELANRLKLVLEVDPKSPSEALAKELRQARLTIDRLQNEKKELEHKIAELEKEQS